MRAWLLWLILAAAGWSETPRYLAVLCYHQIHPRAETEMVTTPERFRQQLDFLQEQGYHTVSLAEAQAFLAGKLPASKVARPLLITFDDGYDGVWKYAYPELKRRHMKAVAFLVCSQMDRVEGTPHLLVKQIREMSRTGVFEFGSHSHALHVPIPERRAAGQVSRYQLKRDLIQSREALQRWTGKEARSLAWPYGHYDEECIKVARESGFRLLFTTDYGYNLAGDGPLRIRRIRLSSVFDTVEVLRLKLATGG